ncbi:MAG: PKD domain-containing protein, partial [Candidatus Tectomicrobia bacterium]|nr:PKD domain-containing protein [Candidatus Tectomicrobia bacterium]
QLLKTFTQPGTYHVTLRVHDHALQTALDPTTITVTAGTPPMAQAGGPYTLPQNQLVQFSGHGSTDDVGIARYLWDFGDNTGSTEINPVHVYARPGTYTVTVTTTDHALQTSTATTTVQTSRVALVDITGMTTDGQTRAVSGTVSAEVVNPETTAMGPFTVLFFADTNSNGRWDAGIDTVLGHIAQPGLSAGATARVRTSVAGALTFRGAPILAFLDTGTPEARHEVQYYASSSQSCMQSPLGGAFDPVLKWQWLGSAIRPNSRQVLMSPAVADLNGDGLPDIVFVSFEDISFATGGTLRALHGRDGRELFTVTSHFVRSASGVAIGDLDGDGRPEILVGAESGTAVLAFAHDGTFLWRSPNIPGGGSTAIGFSGSVAWGGIALADLDGDGITEILIGDAVLNHDGTLRWKGGLGRGTNDHRSDVGPLSLAANLDMAGAPEIVAGNTAYRADGSVYWHRPELTDGFNAVANFDNDPFPEVVLVTHSQVYLLQHDGTLIWGPVFLPPGFGRNAGGPPVVADFDGDGVPDIGVAGDAFFTVIGTDGTVKWSRPVRDPSSNVIGATAFDFDWDGVSEIVFGDEEKLRIYRGRDGLVLWETPSPSGTLIEGPIVVDIDADDHADIVKTASWDFARTSGPAGIRVYSDRQQRWGATRGIWNQQTYHVTNVNDDASIPREEIPSWRTHNSYRQNLSLRSGLQPLADLTASWLRVTTVQGVPQLTARIGNGGALSAPAGIVVAFYDGDPQAGGSLLGTVSTSATLLPGAFEDVTLPVHTTPQSSVWVIADHTGTPNGMVSECNEGNNRYNSGVQVPRNQPPVARAGGPYTVVEGTSLTLDGSGSTDPDGDALTYAWDLNNDGVFDDATGATPTFIFGRPGLFPIALRVSDGTLTPTASTTVTVTNVAPVVRLTPVAPVAVGMPFTHTGMFIDPGTNAWSATVDYGDGTGAQLLSLAMDHTFVLAHDYAGPGTYTVTVTVRDDAGGSSEATVTVTVFQPNRAPVAAAGGPYTIPEGTALTL